MLLEVLKYPHPILKQKAEPIAEITPEILQLAESMLETMYENEGIGLAAPQVGELKRLVVIDLTGPEVREAPMILVNPELELLGEDIESEEGCLSVEDYRNIVKRKERVRLKARSLTGTSIEMDADELFAVCLQHECDHLDGTLFIDHLSRLKRTLYDSKVKKRLKANS